MRAHEVKEQGYQEHFIDLLTSAGDESRLVMPTPDHPYTSLSEEVEASSSGSAGPEPQRRLPLGKMKKLSCATKTLFDN